MKNPLLALALLLAPALAAAGAPIGSTVFVNDPNGMGVGTGTRLPDGGVMGPLCPPDICGAGPEAAAFNAAAAIPPPGTKWRSDSCTHIPCALEDDPTDPRLSDAGEQPVELEEIVVTASRKRGPGIPGAPKETSLGAGVTATATPEGVTFKDSGGRQLTPEQTQALLVAHQAAQDKGFDPTGGFGQQPRRTPPPPSSSTPEAGFVGGLLGDGMAALGSFGDDAPGGGQPAGPGATGPVVYKGEVTALSGDTGAGLESLNRAIGTSRTRGALGALENATKTGEGLGSTPVGPDTTQRQGCDERNPENPGLCAE
jgi:hypothetical protein